MIHRHEIFKVKYGSDNTFRVTSKYITWIWQTEFQKVSATARSFERGAKSGDLFGRQKKI